MKYEVLFALLGVNKALKVAEEATQSTTNSSTAATGTTAGCMCWGGLCAPRNCDPSYIETADLKCPAGFRDDKSGYCMPNSWYTCPKNMYFENGACTVHCAKGFIKLLKQNKTYAECVPDPTLGDCTL